MMFEHDPLFPVSPGGVHPMPSGSAPEKVESAQLKVEETISFLGGKGAKRKSQSSEGARLKANNMTEAKIEAERTRAL
jgi:hypothetical protein